MHRRFFSIALLLACALFPLATFAQVGSTQSLTVTLSPVHPLPYQTVTVTPQSDVIDLSASTITVSVNGHQVAQSTGSVSVPVTVGGLGQTTTIVTAATTGGQTYTDTEVIRPADISLVVEPITTTHPFYQGAALVSPEARVRVIALADLRTSPTSRINPADLEYDWSFGDEQLQDQSGIGRSILSATAPLRYRDAALSVTVSSPDGSIVGEASTLISPVDPTVRIYQVDPLMGPLFDQALSGTYTMNNTEATFMAVPYYFSQTPALAWTLNSVNQSTGPTITMRESGSGSGSSAVGVSGTDPTSQDSASASLSVLFGKASTNIFGF